MRFFTIVDDIKKLVSEKNYEIFPIAEAKKYIQRFE